MVYKQIVNIVLFGYSSQTTPMEQVLLKYKRKLYRRKLREQEKNFQKKKQKPGRDFLKT